MNALGLALGRLCEIALPIRQEFRMGNPESRVAVCTLSSIELLEYMASVPRVMGLVNIIGRLLSENRGIDAMLRYLHGNPRVDTLIVCGSDAAGHCAGHSLLRLHKYGTDNGHDDDDDNDNDDDDNDALSSGKKIRHHHHHGAETRVSRSHSPEPYLRASPAQVRHFRQNIMLVDMVGIVDRAAVIKCIEHSYTGA